MPKVRRSWPRCRAKAIRPDVELSPPPRYATSSLGKGMILRISRARYFPIPKITPRPWR
jgi:hypothetical protein